MVWDMSYWKRRIELDEYNRDEKGFMRGNRPCTKILIHYVFTPKYRRDISKFEGVIESIGHFIESVCWERKWSIENLAIENDHIHILVQLPPTVSISYAAQIIKGSVSKSIRELYPKLKNEISKTAFWGKHYFAKSVGDVDFEKTVKYIEGQGLYKYVPLSVGLQPQRS